MNAIAEIFSDTAFTRFVSQDPCRAVVEHDPAASDSAARERMRREITAELRETMQAEMNAERERSRSLWSAVNREFEEYLANLEAAASSEVLDLSVRMAEIILRRELPDRDMLKSIIKETVDPMTDLQGAKLSLSPAEAEEMNRLKDETGGAQSRIEVVGDDSLQSGDVLIESRNGCFDARVSERLELLKEKISERSRSADANSTRP